MDLDRETMTILAVIGGVYLCSYGAGFLVWLFNRAATSTLDWRRDLIEAVRPIRHILFQQFAWLLGGMAMVAAGSFIEIHEIHGDNYCQAANFVGPLVSLLSVVFIMRISWAIIRMMVVLKAPETLHETAPFFRSLIRLTFVYTLAGIPTGIGWLFFFVPGIFCALLFSLADSACVAKNLGIIQSLKESGDLVSKNFKTVASYIIPVAMLAWLPSLATEPFSLLLDEWQRQTEMTPLFMSVFVGSNVAGFLVNTVMGCALTALAANLYLHLKGQEEKPATAVEN